MGHVIQLAVCAACSDDDDAATRPLNQQGGDEAQPPADPLKDVKEGIHQAPCSMEFWIVIGTVALCFAAAKYLELMPNTSNEVRSPGSSFSCRFHKAGPIPQL